MSMSERRGICRREFLTILGTGSCAMAFNAFSQASSADAKGTYPREKITWIVGHQPGGGNDMLARGVAPFMQKYLKEASGQPDRVGIVIKNIVGGGQMRAMNALYRAKADGYTIGIGGDELHTNAILGGLDFDPFKLTYLARLASSSKVLLTSSKSNLNSWDDVVKASKKAPLKISIGNYGTSNHIGVLLFVEATGLAAKPVFFGGTAGSNSALIRGDVQLGFNSEDAVKTLIEAKELRPLLTFSENTRFSGVASIKDIGYPELAEPIKSQRYVIAPPGLPTELKNILENALKKTVEDKDFLSWNEKANLNMAPVFDPDIDRLVKNIHGFYKSKEKFLTEELSQKKM